VKRQAPIGEAPVVAQPRQHPVDALGADERVAVHVLFPPTRLERNAAARRVAHAPRHVDEVGVGFLLRNK